MRYFKKIFLSISFCCITIKSFNVEASSNITPPKIHAKSYILIDYQTGTVLAEENADKQVYPASLSKIMTSYVVGKAIEEGRISYDDKVVISPNAWAKGNEKIFKGSTLMFLEPKDQVTVRDLMLGVNVQSGNDACVAIAEYLTGSEEAFVGLMNQYAKDLNLTNTHFVNVHGLDANGQHISARDIANLTRHFINELPLEYSTYKIKSFTYKNIVQHNRNRLIYPDYYKPNGLEVDGVKTGHTKNAGYSLVASAKKQEGEGMRLISVVIGTKSELERANESKKLLEWGFFNFDTIKAIKAGPIIKDAKIFFSKEKTISLGVIEDVYITVPKKDLSSISVDTKIDGILKAPLKKGDIVGSIFIKANDKVLQKIPLVVLQDAPKGNFLERFIDQIYLLSVSWL